MKTRQPEKRPMGRPPKPDDERLGVVAIRIDTHLSSRIVDVARQLGVGRTVAARMLIEEALAARKRKAGR
jgi:hypothetical protein